MNKKLKRRSLEIKKKTFADLSPIRMLGKTNNHEHSYYFGGAIAKQGSERLKNR